MVLRLLAEAFVNRVYRRFDMRSVRLGMHDFSRVLRKRLSAILILLGNKSEHLLEFCEGRLARIHQRVAAAKGRDVGHPRAIVLAVKNDLVVVKAHAQVYDARRTSRRIGHVHRRKREGR